MNQLSYGRMIFPVPAIKTVALNGQAFAMNLIEE